METPCGARMKQMLERANLVVSAWDDDPAHLNPLPAAQAGTNRTRYVFVGKARIAEFGGTSSLLTVTV